MSSARFRIRFRDAEYAEIVLRLSKQFVASATFQCPPVTVYPVARKSSAKSASIWTAASNGIGFKCS